MKYFVFLLYLLCINNDEKSGVVVDNSCIFEIIVNSVSEARGLFYLT